MAHCYSDPPIQCKIKWPDNVVEDAKFLRGAKSVGARRYVIVRRDTPEHSSVVSTYEATVPLDWVEMQT